MAKLSKKKLPVCINVFSSLDFVELVQLHDETREIKVTAAIPCSFDPVTRTLSDLELFTQSVRELFVTNRIPFSTPVVLVLPSLLTREFEVPPELSRDEVLMMATSEAERFNIFKNMETQVDLLKVGTGLYVYSAYPAQEIEKLVMAFTDLHIPLKAIEVNYFSLLKGLLATGTISDEAASNESWALIVMGETTFFIGIFQGIQLLTISETLLSQNIDAADLLQEIKDDYTSFTRHHSIEKLVMVNNSSRLDTDAVLELLDLSIPVANIDQKASNLVSRGALEATLPCSLEAIGGVFGSDFKELPSLNLRPVSRSIEGIEELRTKAFYISMGACGVVFLISMLIWGLFSLLIGMKESEVQELVASAQKNEKIKDLGAFADVQQKLFAKKAYNQNIDLNNALVKVEQRIGGDLWAEQILLVNPLEETSAVEKKPLDLRIQGDALSTDKVNELTNNLKKDLARDDLTVPPIETKKKGDVDYWSWTIASKNMVNTPTTQDKGSNGP